MRTRITGGAVIGYRDGRHWLLPKGDVVVEDDRIGYVGVGYPGAVDRTVDAGGCVVIPGLINLHFHAGTDPARALYRDGGRPDFLGAHYLGAVPKREAPPPPPEPVEAAVRANLADCLRFGSTTVVEMGGSWAVSVAAVEAAERLGVRLYAGPGFKSATPYLDTVGAGRLQWDWNEEEGRRGLEAAEDFAREYGDRAEGRIRGMISPLQADTCSDELLQASARAADRLDVPLHMHGAQNLAEVARTVALSGWTPIKRLEDLGVLTPRLILAHALYTDAHPGGWMCEGDFARLSASGASVAHCPRSLARRGEVLHSLGQYQEAGIAVGLGSDVCEPHDLFRDLYLAYVACQWAGGRGRCTAREAFYAATLGAARALRRPDLGRIAPGAKADIVAVRLRQSHLGAVYDPLQTLVEGCHGTDVEWVMVDGVVRVEGGWATGVSAELLAADVAARQAYAERFWQSLPERDAWGRPAQVVMPQTLERWPDNG